MKRLLACIAIFLLTTGLRADVESGPKAGDKVPELKVYAVVGAIEGKEVDYAMERKDSPTVFIFVNAEKFDRPMARFLKTLDGKYTETNDKSMGVAVWVGGDPDKSKDYLPKVNGSMKFEKSTLAVCTDKSGPNGWGINTDAHITAVVVNGGKVVKSFAFVSVNETDTKAVLEELKKAKGK